MLRAQVRRFVETEIKPKALAWEEQGFVPREVLRRMGELGFLGIRYPAEYGGSEMDTLATVVLAEELGRSTFSGVAITVLGPYRHGLGASRSTPAAKRRRTAGCRTSSPARTITAVAVTEPDAGSDVKGIRTIARRDGDSYVLNGTKMFITNGVHADLYCVAAKTDPEARPVAADLDVPGREGHAGLYGQPRARQARLALVRHSRTAFRGLPHSGREPARRGRPRLLRHHAQLPERAHRDRRDGDGRGAGRARPHARLCDARARPSARRCGESRRSASAWRCWRRKVEAGRQLVYHAAWLDTQGVDATKEVSMVKAYCGELVNEVMYDCLQFHGGMGFMRESTIERMARDARVQNIGGGATEVMLEEVAKRL